MIATELTRRLGLRLPIIGAPMAGPSLGKLTRAVSEAGGLGMLGVSNRADAAFVRDEAAIAAAGDAPFGIGLQLWAMETQPGLFDAVCASGAALVAVSFGDPAPYVGPLHEAGTLVASQVSTAEEAVAAARAGVDVVIAQGSDAGGHSGAAVGTLPLLQTVLEALEDTPAMVVAAGGIGTGRGLAAVLAAGAQAGLIGTRLLAATEAAGKPAAKRRVIEADADDTVLTRVFDIGAGLAWPTRYPGRALRNDFSDRWHGHEEDLSAADQAHVLADAARDGDFSQAVIYASSAADFVRAEQPVAEILTQLTTEAEHHLAAAQNLLS